MRKMLKRVAIIGFAVLFFRLGTLAADKQKLANDWVCIQIIGNSDTELKREIVLSVRDGILNMFREGVRDIGDPKAAKEYLQTHLAQLEAVVSEILSTSEKEGGVSIRLGKDYFPTGDSGSVFLPAGVYHTIRVVIGDEDQTGTADAEGAAISVFANDACIEWDDLRFQTLDWIGRIEKKFFRGY